MWLKRLIRPLIPDRLMARYRLRQHSRQARVNVDVLLSDSAPARRWLSTTPDTYRVGVGRGLQPGGSPVGVVVLGDATHRDAAVWALAHTGADAAIVGATTRPRLVGRRRTEPSILPETVVVSSEIHDEVDGVPHGDLVGFVDRLRQAGAHLTVIPTAVAPGRPRRNDPVEAPVVVMFAGVPMHDVGGGSRTTQLALELLRRGVAVVYVSVFGSDEGTDLGVRYVHPRLEQVRLDGFDPDHFVERAKVPGWVLIEIPLDALRDPVSRLTDRGWRVAYDVIDHWTDRALGGEWYRADTERWFLTHSDAVLASAPDLVATARAGGAAEPVLIPNAVNEAVFGGGEVPPPEDLPDAEPLIGYHGSLYGDWIDWASIAAVATAFPNAAVVLIGDASKGHPPMPENVHFLGLKAQSDLPAYLQRFAVGLVPFTVSDTTHAVSPLKVYEYLACGVPVAAPPLRALEGLDGVVVDDDLPLAVTRALAGEPPDGSAALAAHSWRQRAELILDRLGLLLLGGIDAPARIVVRPVTHHAPAARRLG
ncbi:MAG: glycosyltransferase [Acidimicrobiia bacterium]